MARLSFVSDGQLESAVKHLLDVARGAQEKAFQNMGRNVIDPFSVLFQMSGFNITSDVWEKSELRRQAEKTLQNHVGVFHQKILGSVSGWHDLGVGQIVDLECDSRQIIAEVKNKHNTITKGKLADLYHELEKQVMPKHSKYKAYTAYYVEIIPPKPIRFNKEFTPSDKAVGSRCAENTLIRTIDGASFYELVTGERNALQQLFNALPDVIEHLCQNTSGYRFDSLQFVRSFFVEAFGE